MKPTYKVEKRPTIDQFITTNLQLISAIIQRYKMEIFSLIDDDTEYRHPGLRKFGGLVLWIDKKSAQFNDGEIDIFEEAGLFIAAVENYETLIETRITFFMDAPSDTD